MATFVLQSPDGNSGTALWGDYFYNIPEDLYDSLFWDPAPLSGPDVLEFYNNTLNFTRFTGFGFTGNQPGPNDVVITGGTVQTMVVKVNGINVVVMTGGNIPALTLYNAAVANNGPAFANALVAGNDTITGTSFGDNIRSGFGADSVHGMLGFDTLIGENGNDTLFGDNGNDTLFGGNQNDVLYGGLHNDTLFGGPQNDLLFGGDNNDVLIGGPGRDIQSGGPGADRFVIQSVNDSGPTASTRDFWSDYNPVTDTFDVRLIDAFPGGADDAFSLLPRGTASSFVGPGKIGYFWLDLPGVINDRTIVRMNTNGDALIEITIEINGHVTLSPTPGNDIFF